jgi:hypothetical protein
LRDWQYQPFFNSSMNSRGMAIFITKTIDFEINKDYKDVNENFDIMDIPLEGRRYCIGAIHIWSKQYGKRIF